MRTALILAAAGLLLTACSDTPPTSSPATVESEVINVPTTTTSAAPKVLTWGGKGTSTGVDIQLGTPVPDPDNVADPGRRYVLIPVTVTNNANGTATLSFSGRVGQVEAPPMDIGAEPTAKFLPGESGTFDRRFEVPAGGGELVVETYANIDQGPTENRLTFKGPLPPAA